MEVEVRMGSRYAWRHKTDDQLEGALACAERAGTLFCPTDIAERKALQRRTQTGEILEPFEGLYVRREHWRALHPQAQALAALRGLQAKHPSWVFCHQSAAIAHGLLVASWLLKEAHVLQPLHTKRATRKGIVRHRSTCTSGVACMGVCATSLLQTVLDCCRMLPFGDALAIADGCLRFHNVSQRELCEFVEQKGRRKRGVAQARKVTALADGRSESWGESQARALMHELGFVLPDLQVEIALPAELGGTRRVDFLWQTNEGGYVIGEFDGKEKYRLGQRDGFDALFEERQRESRLSILGASIVRFGFNDLKDPMRFARLLAAYGVPRL